MKTPEMDDEEQDLRSQVTWAKLSADTYYLRRNDAFPYYVLDRQRDMGKTTGWSVVRMGGTREHVGIRAKLPAAKRLAEDAFVSMLHSRNETDRVMAETGRTTATVITELQATVRALTMRVTELENERP